jgi:hypothetical protein
VLRDMQRYGALAENLSGLDLLPERDVSLAAFVEPALAIAGWQLERLIEQAISLVPAVAGPSRHEARSW